MPRIQSGRWSELLRRALNLVGTEEVAGELSPEVSPTWELEGSTAEWEFLKGVRLVGGAGELSAVAGQLATFQIVNPADSGVLGILEIVSATQAAGSAFHVRLAQSAEAALATVVQTGPRDTRWRQITTSISALQFTGQTQVAQISVGTLLLDETLNSRVPGQYLHSVVMAPGSTIQWQHQTANTDTRAYAVWKERPLLAVEDVTS